MDLPRPVFLKLSQIHLPLMAVVSILHRISGIVLAIATPFLIYFLSLSLDSLQSYQQLLNDFDTVPYRLVLVFVVWAFGHHIFAGVRLFVIDFSGKPMRGHDSALIVLIMSALSLLLAALVVLL